MGARTGRGVGTRHRRAVRPRSARSFAAAIVRRTGLDVAAGPSQMLDRAVAAVEASLDGRPEPLAAVPLDLIVASDWDRAVLGAVRRVAWGETTSYGQVARAIDRRGAARAVGGAIGRNPIGLAIPVTGSSPVTARSAGTAESGSARARRSSRSNAICSPARASATGSSAPRLISRPERRRCVAVDNLPVHRSIRASRPPGIVGGSRELRT